MVGWGRVARTSMNSIFVHITGMAIAGFVPCSPVMGQDIDGILAASPFQVQSENPVTNSGSTKFGEAIALDGNVLVVGAPNEDFSPTPGDNDSGAVYVFERHGFDWVQAQRLTAPTEIAYENFGSSVGVALGDEGIDYLIAGASGYDGARGRVYFFKRTNGGPWEFEVFHELDNPGGGDRFGQCVAIDYFVPPYSPSGDAGFFAAAGAPMHRSGIPGESENGSVAIFQRTGGPPTWGMTHEFFGATGDRLGSSVAMAEHNIVAGAEGLDEGFFNSGGALIITQGNLISPYYEYVEGKFMIGSDPIIGVGLGLVAAVYYGPGAYHNFAALGAPLHDDGGGNTGKVYVFDLDYAGGSPSFTESSAFQLPGFPPSARFGTSIALWGDLLAAGAPGVGTDGTVFLYERGADLGEWNPAGELTVPNVPPVGACFGGTAVEVGETMAAVGCPSASGIDNRAVFMYLSATIFDDGFEVGSAARWSGGTDICPPCTEDIGCRVVNGKNIFVVPMGLGQSGNGVCSAQGYQCVDAPVMIPPESACLAFHPGADVTFDSNGWRQAVWCNDDDGLACSGRIGCHHCPDCITTGLTCETENSTLLSELFVECVCTQ